MPLEEKKRRAHIVLDNSGTPAQLSAQTVFARVRPKAWAWAPEEEALPAPARAG